MNPLLGYALLVFGLSTACAQDLPWKKPGDDFPFKEQRDLNAGDFRGRSSLVVSNQTLGTNDLLFVNVTFENTGVNGRFFNPFLNPNIGLPARLAFYDQEKQYLGNWLTHGISSRELRPDDVLHIPTGGHVGITLPIRVLLLPPGEYYVQVIWDGMLLSRSNGAPAVRSPDLFRSNAVKITILQR